jgi:hypothetical protein
MLLPPFDLDGWVFDLRDCGGCCIVLDGWGGVGRASAPRREMSDSLRTNVPLPFNAASKSRSVRDTRRLARCCSSADDIGCSPDGNDEGGGGVPRVVLDGVEDVECGGGGRGGGIGSGGGGDQESGQCLTSSIIIIFTSGFALALSRVNRHLC